VICKMASKGRRVFVVGVGMTKVIVCRYKILHHMNFSMLLIL
jgi:hypothetical protein